MQFLLDAHGEIIEMKMDIPNEDFWFTELELRRKEPVEASNQSASSWPSADPPKLERWTTLAKAGDQLGKASERTEEARRFVLRCGGAMRASERSSSSSLGPELLPTQEGLRQRASRARGNTCIAHGNIDSDSNGATFRMT